MWINKDRCQHLNCTVQGGASRPQRKDLASAAQQRQVAQPSNSSDVSNLDGKCYFLNGMVSMNSAANSGWVGGGEDDTPLTHTPVHVAHDTHCQLQPMQAHRTAGSTKERPDWWTPTSKSVQPQSAASAAPCPARPSDPQTAMSTSLTAVHTSTSLVGPPTPGCAQLHATPANSGTDAEFKVASSAVAKANILELTPTKLHAQDHGAGLLNTLSGTLSAHAVSCTTVCTTGGASPIARVLVLPACSSLRPPRPSRDLHATSPRSESSDDSAILYPTETGPFPHPWKPDGGNWRGQDDRGCTELPMCAQDALPLQQLELGSEGCKMGGGCQIGCKQPGSEPPRTPGTPEGAHEAVTEARQVFDRAESLDETCWGGAPSSQTDIQGDTPAEDLLDGIAFVTATNVSTHTAAGVAKETSLKDGTQPQQSNAHKAKPAVCKSVTFAPQVVVHFNRSAADKKLLCSKGRQQRAACALSHCGGHHNRSMQACALVHRRADIPNWLAQEIPMARKQGLLQNVPVRQVQYAYDDWRKSMLATQRTCRVGGSSGMPEWQGSTSAIVTVVPPPLHTALVETALPGAARRTRSVQLHGKGRPPWR
jgi:hypothetical protein